MDPMNLILGAFVTPAAQWIASKIFRKEHPGKEFFVGTFSGILYAIAVLIIL